MEQSAFPDFVALSHKVLKCRYLELALDGVERPALDVALDAAEVLAHEREDEALDAEHEEHQDAKEERAWEVRVLDPEADRVDEQPGRDERAQDPERDSDPLDRLRPEPREDVQRKSEQQQR